MKTYEIEKHLVPLIRDLLTRDRPITNTPFGTVMFDYGIRYSKDTTIKIQICNGRNPYVQAELYKSGKKVQTVGPFSEIFIQYNLSFDGIDYQISINPEK